ncbi:cyclic-phosphate processing receiver domain-containing protein [Geomicrobium sp. JCM 19038]|uniref:cyclic-phosphate processing receiver domain-containing protein n=1 Tax=Geomicrobium sp. JCM 19038 TaxID=1460635 RepID=UPI00045F3A5C|nr:cyclic-phosphate processing receiver domain-containing protein [Geomicrobium sp. JCM 19038]GAK09063.1 hypothetical protein JCM19038_2879 [Geomicrobium sp. JCM 19038]
MDKVFMDDVRESPGDHHLVRTAEDCIAILKTDLPLNHLSLDHDLGTDQKNGFEVVQYMIDHRRYAERITVHSANAPAGKRMYDALTEARRQGSFPYHVKIYLRPLPLDWKQH